MAFDIGGLDLGAKVRIRIEGELRETTFGRALFNETLPLSYPFVEMQLDQVRNDLAQFLLADLHLHEWV